MACLVAEYKAMNGAGTRPRTELTLMIRPPPCSRMCGSTARVIRIDPKTLVSKSARACSIELSSAAPAMPTPALLTRTSIRPDRSSTSRTTPATDTSSVTSSGREPPPPPRPPGGRPPARAVHSEPGADERMRGRLTDPRRRSRHKRYGLGFDCHDVSFSRLHYGHNTLVRP